MEGLLTNKRKRGVPEHGEWETGWFQKIYGTDKKLGTSKITYAKCLECVKLLESFESDKLKKT